MRKHDYNERYLFKNEKRLFFNIEGRRLYERAKDALTIEAWTDLLRVSKNTFIKLRDTKDILEVTKEKNKYVEIEIGKTGQYVYRLTDAGKKYLESHVTDSYVELAEVFDISKTTLSLLVPQYLGKRKPLKTSESDTAIIRERNKYVYTKQGKVMLTDAGVEFIKENVGSMSLNKLCQALSVAKKTLETLIQKHGIEMISAKPGPKSLKASTEFVNVDKRMTLTDEGIKLVKENIDTEGIVEMSKRIGVSKSTLCRLCKWHGIEVHYKPRTKHGMQGEMAKQKIGRARPEAKPKPKPQPKLKTHAKHKLRKQMSEEDKKFIIDNYGKKSNTAIREALGVSSYIYRTYIDALHLDDVEAKVTLNKEHKWKLEIKKGSKTSCTVYLTDKNKVQAYKKSYGNGYEYLITEINGKTEN